MYKCNAIIKTGPRKGLECKNRSILGSLKCNIHNKRKDEKIILKNIYKLPNEILIKIIEYIDIINIIKFRLVNKYFLSACDYILNKYVNLNSLLYSRLTYGLNGGHIDLLFKILNIQNKKLKITPLTIINKKLIKEKSKYIQDMPVYENYRIKYNISLTNPNDIFYVYKFMSDGKIKFYTKNSKKNIYLHSIMEIWNNQDLSELKYYG
jgi:hypothetical protein